jgi:hypothetical protein
MLIFILMELKIGTKLARGKGLMAPANIGATLWHIKVLH